MSKQAIGSHLEAFCSTCPTVQEVTRFLQPMGFSLQFHMDAVPAQQGAMPLPAQYHYEDNYGTQVLYLAGRDYAGDNLAFPLHRSRWWVYPGSSQEICSNVVRCLALRWFLLWFPSHHDEQQRIA